MKDLSQLFHHMLMDVYYAEQKILKSLPKMAQKAKDRALIEAFDMHFTETEGQIDRLERVFEMLDRKPQGETCEALDGLVAEAEEIMQDATTDAVRDAGLLAAAQAVEHYEISRYGTLVAWAQELGLDEAAGLLQETLDQEYAADELLDRLASEKINKLAA